MTAEVCIMNRLAAVLAADSATTVTYWNEGKEEKRYFKGANKIFQLSNTQPVGMMIFDNAGLIKVPWEIIAKEFRKRLGKRSHDHVEGYANEFFSFLDADQRLFPLAARRESFLEGVKSSVIRHIIANVDAVPQNDPNAAQTANTLLAAVRAELDALQLPSCTNAGKLAKLLQDLKAEARAEADSFAQYLLGTGRPFAGDLDAVAEIGIIDVVKKPGGSLGTTGIVFAGFGMEEIFPVAIEYQSCSFVGEDHVEYKIGEHKIERDIPARLVPFAQRSMTDTFRIGISGDLLTHFMNTAHAEMGKVAADIVAAAGGNPIPVANLTQMLLDARSRLFTEIMERARQTHSHPLQRVIGSLPVEEMADLAETLVSLQSLKERVTKPTEEVGGPVDVAVITRSEGLVWVKRKHYFPPELNPRFHQRQSGLYK